MDMPMIDLVTDDLPPPVIEQSADGQLLDPAAVRHTMAIRVDYDWLSDDSFTINWNGAPGSGPEGSYTSPKIPVGNFSRPFRTHLENLLVAFSLGQSVTVTYTVYRGTAQPVTSRPLVLYIYPIAQRDLPRPFITEAENGGQGLYLSVSDLTRFTLRTNGWLLGRRGQFFWLKLTGTHADGSVFESQYWQAPSHVINDEFSFFGFYEEQFPVAPLQRLKDLSVLTLEFMAGLQRSQDPALAQKFAHRNYIVLANPVSAPTITSVTDPDGREIADGADTLFNRVTLSGAAIAEVTIFDGDTRLGTAAANVGVWTFPATALTVGRHVFTARYADGGVSRARVVNVLENRQVRIKESTDNAHLNPSAVTSVLTYVLDYPSLPDDRISVQWIAAPGTPAAGSYTSARVSVFATPREIRVPVTLVAYSLGKMVEVRATYLRANAPEVTLQPLTLSVLPIPSDLLIAPVIDEAGGSGELDKRAIVGGATLTFVAWPHMARNQRLSLDLRGFSANGGVNDRSVWTPARDVVQQIWVTNRGFTTTIAADYLLSLGVGTVLSIVFTVRTDQVADSTAVTVFEPRRYTIVDTR